MAKDIIITVNTETKQIIKNDSLLGICSENLQGKIIFTPTPFIDGVCYMHIENHGCIEMKKEEDHYTLDILSSLLMPPKINVCFKIVCPKCDEGVPVFVTKIIDFRVLDTIESNEPIPEQYPQWKDVLDNYTEEKKGELDTYTTEIQTDLKTYKKDLEDEMSTTKDTLVGEITATATDETNKFNTNAESKTNAFNNNATEKTTNYNTNAETKLKEYNDNATTKTEEYNTNATNKVNEFNNNVDSLENELTELASQMPWNTTEIQDSIHVEDSAKYSRNKLGLFGNLEQEKFSGRNKIPTEWEYWESGHYDTNGLKTTYGSRCRLKELYPVLPSTTYYMNLNTSDSLGFSVMIRGFNSDKVFNENLGVIKNKSAFTTSNNTYYVAITIGHSDTATAIDYEPLFANGTIKPFMCLNSEIDKTFEIYTGGEATPNINYPSMPVVATGVQKIRRIGKNFLDLSQINKSGSQNGLEFKVENGKVILNGTTTARTDVYILGYWGNSNKTRFHLPKGQYILSIKSSIKSETSKFQLLAYSGNTNLFNCRSIDTYIKEFDKDVYLGNMYLSIPAERTFNNEIYEIQIEQGDTATDYEPYTEETFELDLGTTELCKIVDENGNVVAQDRVAYKDGKWQFEKNVRKVVLNGNEKTWSTNVAWDTEFPDFRHYYTKLEPDSNYKIGQSNVVLDKFKFNLYVSYKEYSNTECCMCNKTNSNPYFNVKSEKANTLQDWLNYVRENNITMYYETEVSEYEDCTQAQSQVLDKLYKLSLQQGTNNIYVESENGVTTELQLTYMQDLMSQINELKQAMLNIGGN